MKSDIRSDLSSDRRRSQTAPAVALQFSKAPVFFFVVPADYINLLKCASRPHPLIRKKMIFCAQLSFKSIRPL